jgi:hypothetical protein
MPRARSEVDLKSDASQCRYEDNAIGQYWYEGHSEFSGQRVDVKDMSLERAKRSAK